MSIKDMMYIKEIENYDEANSIVGIDVIVTDGTYSIRCFCDFIEEDLHENSLVKELSTMFFEDDFVRRAKSNETLVVKIGNHYNYHLQGRVVDKDIPMIAIGELIIELDAYLPGDIRVGDFVECNVGRIDCSV